MGSFDYIRGLREVKEDRNQEDGRLYHLEDDNNDEFKREKEDE